MSKDKNEVATIKEVSAGQLTGMIYNLRGVRVMLDAD